MAPIQLPNGVVAIADYLAAQEAKGLLTRSLTRNADYVHVDFLITSVQCYYTHLGTQRRVLLPELQRLADEHELLLNEELGALGPDSIIQPDMWGDGVYRRVRITLIVT